MRDYQRLINSTQLTPAYSIDDNVRIDPEADHYGCHPPHCDITQQP